MQFVTRGPNVPERLIEAHEDGRVVFFCGAGISYPAGLPGFKGLVEKIYDSLAERRTADEEVAFANGQFDTTLGLLEKRLVGGRAALREKIAQALHPDLKRKGALATHEALLQLARVRPTAPGGESRMRLITTNFDRLFEEASLLSGSACAEFSAPLLPVPKKRWDGLVYLHGRLSASPTAAELDRLVVTSGDFGLAYLAERWASRFVSELFRNYTICFLGYSINDPVLRYMMDALAADRLLGESPPEAFAFGAYPAGRPDRAEAEWVAKNVTPVLYRQTNDHRYLHRTLSAWANVYRDGISGKERIVVEHAVGGPGGSTDEEDVVGRVLWSLCDRSSVPARRFAEMDPIPPIEWLDAFTNRRFLHDDLVRFGVQPNRDIDRDLRFSLLARPAPYRLSAWLTLVDPFPEYRRYDDIMHQLARWLARHIHAPLLAIWVCKQGGRLHPGFAHIIERAIEQDKSLSNAMRVLWEMILAGLMATPADGMKLYEWAGRWKRVGLTPSLRIEFRQLFSPRVTLSPREIEATEATSQELPAAIVESTVELATTDAHSLLDELRQNAGWREAEAQLLTDSTDLLRLVLDIRRPLGDATNRSDSSYVSQPSIGPHKQSQKFYDWTALIELVRDGMLAAAELWPDDAAREIGRWKQQTYPLFRRLVLYAAANTSLMSVDETTSYLLEEDHWWLWSVETQRETIRLIVALALRNATEQLQSIERAILIGPPRAMFREDAEDEALVRICDREVWLRLAKLESTNGSLSEAARDRLRQLRRRYPEWQLSEDEREEFPFWMGGDEDWRTFLASPSSRQELAAWLVDHPDSDIQRDDDWRERCKADFPRAATALLLLARQSIWIGPRWAEALAVWSEKEFARRSWRWLGRVLNDAPNVALVEMRYGLGRWLRTIGTTAEIDKESSEFLSLVSKVIDSYRNEVLPDDDDPVSAALNHPIGQLTEGLFHWWYRHPLKDGDTLAASVARLLNLIADPDVPVFRLGRVFLAKEVVSLFRVDPQWTKDKLLSRFDWMISQEEAHAAWAGFLMSPRMHRPLLSVIKRDFLSTSKHVEKLGRSADQYVALLALAGLEFRDIFGEQSLSRTVRLLPSDRLSRMAQGLVNFQKGAGERRSEYWINRTKPFIQRCWPKSNEKLTPGVSLSFASLVVASGSNFPDALAVLRAWLRPLDSPGHLIDELLSSKNCSAFPGESLSWLDAVISTESVVWIRPKLQECLTLIEEQQPALVKSEAFRRLTAVSRP